MTFRSSLLVVGALAVFAAPAIAADVPADAKAAIDAAYKTNCTAALDPTDANLDKMAAILAPEYQSENVKGDKKVDRDTSIAQGKQQLKQIHGTACDVKVEDETLNADGTITATTSFTFSGELQAPDGKHAIDVTARAKDTWKKVGDAWLESYSKDLKNLVKLDGNVVQDEGD